MRLSTTYKLVKMVRKVIDFFKDKMVLIIIVAFATSTLDLLSLTVGSKTFSAGWVLAFALFFGAVGYSIYNSFKK